MKNNIKVLLVDEDSGRSAVVERALLDNGYDVVGRITTEEDIPQVLAKIDTDVVIYSMESPDEDILESIQSISLHIPKPVVMFADKSDSETLQRAVKAGVSACIVDGLSESRIKPIMDVAIARFREFQALKEELSRTKTDLADRKVIDKAKGIIMQQRDCTEDEAYKALRKLAMDRNEKLVNVARNVIEVATLFG
ncbi:MAG: ANTAR domain-containing protein [Gammaproteobacteria bacterium]|nr:ANTAR domain-containing protein [Gammaproteobacteria bacterium]MDH5652698.1 ANTAR domain-containing protein [Gammaproteobacteria bacterium]